jgi:2,4-didehydro-3-deoxy-L-rhamnonate hydrolase
VAQITPFSLGRIAPGVAGDLAQLCIVAGEQILPLTPADLLGCMTINEVLDRWSEVFPRLAARAASTAREWVSADSVNLAAPIEPRQVLQAGANYKSHVLDIAVAQRASDEKRTVGEIRRVAAAVLEARVRAGNPYLFVGMPAAVVGTDVELVLSNLGTQHDWELELGVVIGRRAFRVTRAQVPDYIAGYTIVNDITMRDLVFRKDMERIGTDWYRSKNAPGFLPTGPYFVPAEFVPDAGDLTLRLELNGEVMQNASTADLLFDIPSLVSAASQTAPLLPGDLILTGSPEGNGLHWGRLLRPGDVLRGSITGLGTQVVHCVADPTPLGPELEDRQVDE